MSRGFSIIELLIVLAIISILSGLTLFYLSSHQRLYRPDEQSLRIIDVLQEARQRSLTQRETMRVEIDLTDNVVRLIDENDPDTADDDLSFKTTVLAPNSEIKTGERPPDVVTDPIEPLPVPVAQFKTSDYPLSASHKVCTFRFLRNGTVVNEGTSPVGANAVTTGVTLFIWSPKKDAPEQSEIARAITVVGASGSVRFWEYSRTSTDANKWKDSRRSGVYGGRTGGSSEQ